MCLVSLWNVQIHGVQMFNEWEKEIQKYGV